MTTQPCPSNFGDISALLELFSDSKKLRRVRHPAHVMIVEDDPLTRRVVANAFAESHAMIAEEDGRGAVASYLLHAPDVVFLDIGLPDVDGFAVLSQIMSLDPEAYIVMFSGHTDSNTINKALSAGAKGFVSKPFKKDELKRHINSSVVHHQKSPM